MTAQVSRLEDDGVESITREYLDIERTDLIFTKCGEKKIVLDLLKREV